MSFDQNDNMKTITLGNYEEFFILYMDNELSKDQAKMVQEFLAAHPDLKAELEMLKSTKLPMEELSFDKQELMSGKMKLTAVNEDLLLYIDNELPADKRRTIELELASNTDYQLQHQLLLQTKLDPSEKIIYPNKKELYHKIGKVVAFRMWMRVAAAVVVIAVSAMLYFMKPSLPAGTDGAGITAGTTEPVEIKNPGNNEVKNPGNNSSQDPDGIQLAAIAQRSKKNNATVPAEKKVMEDNNSKPVYANVPLEKIEEEEIERPLVRNIDFGDTKTEITETTAALNFNSVTSFPDDRLDNSSGDDGKIASNDRKGSVKGFLRKATRMIEKRTGFDPTNEDGALLIGAVAINLK